MTSNQPHAATRGAVWFACRLDGQGNPRVSEMRMFPFVVEALEQVRARLADECRDARFDPAHVQTNLGLLGPYGTHPSAVADHVAIRLTVKTGANPNRVLMHLTELLDATLADYGVRYGDLTRQLDPITGNPRLAAHYKLTPEPLPDRLGFRLDIHGKAGHMGALTECDNALSKASFLLMAMLRFTRNFPKVVGDAQLIDAPPGPLVLEGGQGFLPTHTLEEVQTRLAEAARTGVRTFCDLTRVPFHEGMVRTTFDKLRSEAHASPVDCPPMRAFAAAFAALGRPCAETRGWPVSCDARLFGQRGLPTVVFGPGSLLQAHSPDEHISIREMQDAVAIGTLADLYLGGALPEPA
jgi:hypothetical protein